MASFPLSHHSWSLLLFRIQIPYLVFKALQPLLLPQIPPFRSVPTFNLGTETFLWSCWCVRLCAALVTLHLVPLPCAHPSSSLSLWSRFKISSWENVPQTSFCYKTHPHH